MNANSILNMRKKGHWRFRECFVRLTKYERRLEAKSRLDAPLTFLSLVISEKRKQQGDDMKASTVGLYSMDLLAIG